MYVVCVTVFVKPELLQPFIDATFDNARATRKESANVRFDVIQAEDDPTRFMLYEAYQSKDGFVDHQKTQHYAAWKTKVADWMAQPRQGVKHNALFFGDSTV